MAKAGNSKKPMTKSQLIAHLADASGMAKKAVASFMDEILKVAYREAKKDGGFVFPGLGKLIRTKSKARVGRHPKTGEPIQIPARTRLKFRVAKHAKDAILGAK